MTAHDPITAVLNIGEGIINKIWPDPMEALREQTKLAEIAQNGDLAELNAYVTALAAQLKVNEKEAGHPSIFVAGWRPFVGWVCGFSLLYAAFIFPTMKFIALLNSYVGEFPDIDTAITLQLLFGMLGLGGYRSFEKLKGVAREKWHE